MSTLRILLPIVCLLSSCTTLRMELVATPGLLRPDAVSLAPITTSGLFGYEDWEKNWTPLAESLARQKGLPLVPRETAGTSELRLYLSDKTFVRGYQTLHALYATLDLVDPSGSSVLRVHYSEESADTLESSHKLLQVMEACFEKLAQGLPKATTNAGGSRE